MMKFQVCVLSIGLAAASDIALYDTVDAYANALTEIGSTVEGSFVHNIRPPYLGHGHHVPYERGPLNCTCPDTFYLNGDRCERTVRFPLESLCPLGYAQIDAQTCIKETFPDERCPFGFARVKSECVRRDVTIPQLACPEGYEFESTAAWSAKSAFDQLICVQRIPVEPIYECPDGTNFEGYCTGQQVVLAEHYCPPGYTPGENNTCWQVQDIECKADEHSHLGHIAQTHNAISALDHIGSLAHGIGAHPRKLTAVSALASTVHNQLTNLDRQRAAFAARAHGWKTWRGDGHHITPPTPVISIDQVCTANVTIPATPYCTAGTLRGELCLEKVPEEPVLVCPAYGTVADCFAYDRVAPQSACPAGFREECGVHGIGLHKNVECDCVQILQEPVQVFCPPGAALEDNICVSIASPFSGCPLDARLVAGACEQQEFAPCECHYNIKLSCQGPSCPHKRF